MIKLTPFLFVSALFQDTKKPVLAEDSTGVADRDLSCPSHLYITRIEEELRFLAVPVPQGAFRKRSEDSFSKIR